MSKLSNKSKERTASETSREDKENSGLGGYIISILIHIPVLILFCVTTQGEFESWCVCDQSVNWEGSVELAIQDENPSVQIVRKKGCYL